MVGGRRKKPRARQGADVKIGPAAKSSSPGYRDRGSGSYDPTGYEVVRECALSVRPELAETNTWRLTCGPSYEVFGRRHHGAAPLAPAAGVSTSARARSREEAWAAGGSRRYCLDLEIRAILCGLVRGGFDGQEGVAIDLTEEERRELEGLTSRRRTA